MTEGDPAIFEDDRGRRKIDRRRRKQKDGSSITNVEDDRGGKARMTRMTEGGKARMTRMTEGGKARIAEGEGNRRMDPRLLMSRMTEGGKARMTEGGKRG